jgi:hypothetical protein
MATVEENGDCVLWLAELLYVTAVKKRFTAHCKNNWIKKGNGSRNDEARSGRPRIGEGTVPVVQEAFERSQQQWC